MEAIARPMYTIRCVPNDEYLFVHENGGLAFAGFHETSYIFDSSGALEEKFVLRESGGEVDSEAIRCYVDRRTIHFEEQSVHLPCSVEGVLVPTCVSGVSGAATVELQGLNGLFISVDFYSGKVQVFKLDESRQQVSFNGRMTDLYHNRYVIDRNGEMLTVYSVRNGVDCKYIPLRFV